jgi:hypothetical protein
MEQENVVSDEWESEFGESNDEREIFDDQDGNELEINLDKEDHPIEAKDPNELFKIDDKRRKKNKTKLDKESVENKLIELGLIANNPQMVREIANFLREKNVSTIFFVFFFVLVR